MGNNLGLSACIGANRLLFPLPLGWPLSFLSLTLDP